MQDEPTPVELIQAVAGFLRADVAPHLSGHAAFKLRVALNALDLVARQLTLEAGSDAAELERLSKLLGRDGSLRELNRALSARIASGEMDAATPDSSITSGRRRWTSSRSISRTMRRTAVSAGKGRALEVFVPGAMQRFSGASQNRDRHGSDARLRS